MLGSVPSALWPCQNWHRHVTVSYFDMFFPFVKQGVAFPVWSVSCYVWLGHTRQWFRGQVGSGCQASLVASPGGKQWKGWVCQKALRGRGPAVNGPARSCLFLPHLFSVCLSLDPQSSPCPLMQFGRQDFHELCLSFLCVILCKVLNNYMSFEHLHAFI